MENNHLDVDCLVESYLGSLDWRVNENANVGYSFGGLMLHISGAVNANYVLHRVYPKKVADAHRRGDFHIHDLAMGLNGYCAGWSIRQLLLEGFNGVPGKIYSLPPKHLSTVMVQLVNFLGTLQNEWAGAQALSSFDTYLAPFIAYDKLDYRQTRQLVQQFIFDMNTPSRWGTQTPFTNVSLDWTVPEDLAKESVIIGGKLQKSTYAEFSKEMAMINKAFIEIMTEGDAAGQPFTFPIPTYNITKDFDWNSENADLLFGMTAKFGTPYFQNFINSDLKPSDTRSMCLGEKEEIIIRNSRQIRRLSIKEVAEDYKSEDFDQEGWAECKKEGGLEVLSLNPETLKLEWCPVERFLRITDKRLVEIMTEDGKQTEFSLKHPVAVYTPEGIRMKFAQDVQKGDYLLTTRKANEILSKEYQKIGEGLLLNENLAKILGYFIADGNYLFETRRGYSHYGEPKGIQFTFRTGDKENLRAIKVLSKKVFGLAGQEKQDPRYNTYYLYVYNSKLARKLYQAGFKKYGRLPQVLFNSPPNVIENFLNFYFKGDGYARREEIHLNDLELSRDIVLLFTLIGQPVTYRLRKKSQVIYLQHASSKTKRGNGAHTPESLKIKNSDIYLTKVKRVKTKTYNKIKEFYDIELERNHLFLHSLGQISFNCCRLRLELKQLAKKTGGLFGFGESTGSVGVVTINLPRLGHLSKSKKEFFARLERLMELAYESLEIKRKVVQKNMDRGLLPYTKRYLGSLRHHFSTIGLVGGNEACLNLLGKSIAEVEGKALMIDVLKFMRDKLTEFQKRSGEIYNLEATPAEGTTYRFAKIDKKLFGKKIITAGTNQAPYYTNSTHLPVDTTDDLFAALEHQDDLQVLYTGGCLEAGNKVLTDRGLLNIEEIVANFGKLRPIRTISYNSKRGIGQWDEIIEALAIDVKRGNKIRVKGERGLDIVTSDWHPFFVLERVRFNKACPVCKKELRNIKVFATHLRYRPDCRKKYKALPRYGVLEKRADALRVGDYILQNCQNLYPAGDGQLNHDLMWLIGFFIGDGCFSEFIDNRGGNSLKKYKVRFFSENIQALERVKKILGRYFQAKVNIIQNDQRSKVLREVSSSKKTVADFFYKYGFKMGRKVYDVSVPPAIKENLTMKNVFSFLVGLMDSDGHVGKRDGDFEYYTVSPRLADDILEICSRAGIMIGKTRKPTKRKNEVDIWRLRVPSYQVTRIKDQLTKATGILKIKKDLSNRKKRQLPVVRVREVSKADVQNNQFYDLMTKENHNYLAGKNSLVFVHNTVLHGFLGEKVSDHQACRSLVKKVAENFRLPYYTITPTFSICPGHGYFKNETTNCPRCGKKTLVYSRVVGYLRPVVNWNKGKKQEFKERLEYSERKSLAHETRGLY